MSDFQTAINRNMPQGVAGEVVNNAATTGVTLNKVPINESGILRGVKYGTVHSYVDMPNGERIVRAGRPNIDGAIAGINMSPKVDVKIYEHYESHWNTDTAHNENKVGFLLTKGCAYVYTRNEDLGLPKPKIGDLVFFHRGFGVIHTGDATIPALKKIKRCKSN